MLESNKAIVGTFEDEFKNKANINIVDEVMTPQNRVIENPIEKTRTTFVKTGEETNGEYLLLKEELAPHGGTPMHYHLSFTEKFEVLEGQLNIMISLPSSET